MRSNTVRKNVKKVIACITMHKKQKKFRPADEYEAKEFDIDNIEDEELWKEEWKAISNKEKVINHGSKQTKKHSQKRRKSTN